MGKENTSSIKILNRLLLVKRRSKGDVFLHRFLQD